MLKNKNRLILVLIVWFAFGTAQAFADEWIDTDGDGEDDTLVMDPFVVEGDDFNWDEFWEYLDGAGFDFLTNQNEDVFFDDAGYSGGGNFSTWESQQSSENHLGITLKGSQNDINTVKSWINNIANHANQTIANEFSRLTGLAAANNLAIDWRLGTGSLTIGNYANQALDVQDVQKFPTSTGLGATRDSVFAHELFEQLYKQVEGKSFDDAHALAIERENEIAGMIRGNAYLTNYPDGSTSMTTTFTSLDGTLSVDQTQHFDANHNLTSVTSP